VGSFKTLKSGTVSTLSFVFSIYWHSIFKAISTYGNIKTSGVLKYFQMSIFTKTVSYDIYHISYIITANNK